MEGWDRGRTWYHGSPFELTVLRAGSTVTQNQHLAEVFSHKPAIVSIGDDGTLQHNGAQPGILYIVDEPLGPADVCPHPRTTMPPNFEWLTARDLNLKWIGPVEPRPHELLSAAQVAELLQRTRTMQTPIPTSNPNLTISPFKPADQAAARALILEGLGEHFGWIDETRNPDVDDIAAHYLAKGHAFVVARSDGEMVGTGALLTLSVPDGVGQMVRVSVSRSRRRGGIGAAIARRLLDVARQRGLRRVQVETNNDWYDAIRLYERLGFAEYARDDESVYLALEIGEVREEE
jgi:ribosomal protein S18 acetylase RimI-like enzyme